MAKKRKTISLDTLSYRQLALLIILLEDFVGGLISVDLEPILQSVL
jgi:hypothetical protein